MGRASLLDHYRQPVTDYIQQGCSQQETVGLLQQHYGASCTVRSLQRAIKRWGLILPSHLTQREDIEELHEIIRYNVLELGLTDEETLAILNEQGYDVTARQLRSIRMELGILRRQQGADNLQAHDLLIEQRLRQEYLEGPISAMGKERLVEEMRAKYGIFGRDRIRARARQLPAAYHHTASTTDNTGASHQDHTTDTVRVVYEALGPNQVWSVGAHRKLEGYGVYIYGAIDAYSRNIMWVHVGISARTSLSILCQYINCLDDNGVVPQFIRGDSSEGTGGLATVHRHLSQALRPELDGDEDVALPFCYDHVKSKDNLRIKHYWGQQAQAALNFWYDWFVELEQDGLFQSSSPSDRIAFLAVYIPILRKVAFGFTITHNHHRIRKQAKSPHAVTGLPELLYRHPSQEGTRDYGLPVDRAMLEEYKQRFADYDMEEYLPTETLTWCNQALVQLGFVLPVAPFERFGGDGQRKHVRAYLMLRAAVTTHMNRGNDPILHESRMPCDESWKAALDEAKEAASARSRTIVAFENTS